MIKKSHHDISLFRTDLTQASNGHTNKQINIQQINTRYIENISETNKTKKLFNTKNKCKKNEKFKLIEIAILSTRGKKLK